MSQAATPPSSSDVAAPPARAINARLFVIGCARSGTTLLQSFLAAHPQVLSFPETAVFSRLFVAPLAGDASANMPAGRIAAARERASTFLDAVGRRELTELLAGPDASIAEFARSFVDVLDRLALDGGKQGWTEKTPKHLALVPEIRQLVPGARFILVLRDGRQNVASLYDAARRYPNVWWPAGLDDLDQAIQRWNQSARRARQLRGDADVLLVRYEKLISHTVAVLQEICAFAGLSFKRDMVERRAEVAREVVGPGEPWKAGVFETVQPAGNDKFDRLFTTLQKAYIEARLERIDF
jgi:hypothetical protein